MSGIDSARKTKTDSERKAEEVERKRQQGYMRRSYWMLNKSIAILMRHKTANKFKTLDDALNDLIEKSDMLELQDGERYLITFNQGRDCIEATYIKEHQVFDHIAGIIHVSDAEKIERLSP